MSIDPSVNSATQQTTVNTATEENIKTDRQPSLIQKGEGLQVVIGLGASGLAAVNYLVKRGYSVAVTDGQAEPKLAAQLPDAVTIRAFGEIDDALLRRAARIVISPGVPLSTPAVAAVKQAGTQIVSDIQLFKDACKAPIVAITGSNAKSTVTTLVGQMAKDAGINVGVGGNIGVPALSLLDDPTVANMGLAVLELSSFQLESVSNLGATVATVLNMTPDHLDRHGDMLGYHQAKHRIFQGAKSIVVNRGDALSRPLVADNLPRLSFGENAPDKGEYGLIHDEGGQLYLARGHEKLLDATTLKIKGKHNLLNVLAALAIGELVDIPIDSMVKTIREFAGLPHRCEFVGEHENIDYFNDSKGTNVGSTKAAIAGLGSVYQATGLTTTDKSKLLLILGGQAKNQKFAELVPLINQYVSQILYIGEDAETIADDLAQAGIDDSIGQHQCQTLEKAFDKVQQLTKSSLSEVAAVLMSPACASFDQYSGYAERGEHFKVLVASL